MGFCVVDKYDMEKLRPILLLSLLMSHILQQNFPQETYVLKSTESNLFLQLLNYECFLEYGWNYYILQETLRNTKTLEQCQDVTIYLTQINHDLIGSKQLALIHKFILRMVNCIFTRLFPIQLPGIVAMSQPQKQYDHDVGINKTYDYQQLIKSSKSNTIVFLLEVYLCTQEKKSIISI